MKEREAGKADCGCALNEIEPVHLHVRINPLFGVPNVRSRYIFDYRVAPCLPRVYEIDDSGVESLIPANNRFRPCFRLPPE